MNSARFDLRGTQYQGQIDEGAEEIIHTDSLSATAEELALEDTPESQKVKSTETVLHADPLNIFIQEEKSYRRKEDAANQNSSSSSYRIQRPSEPIDFLSSESFGPKISNRCRNNKIAT